MSDNAVDQLLKMSYAVGKLRVALSPRSCATGSSVRRIYAVNMPRYAIGAWIFTVALESNLVSTILDRALGPSPHLLPMPA